MRTANENNTINTDAREVVLYSTDWTARWTKDWCEMERVRQTLHDRVTDLHQYKQDEDTRDFVNAAMNHLVDAQLMLLKARKRVASLSVPTLPSPDDTQGTEAAPGPDAARVSATSEGER